MKKVLLGLSLTFLPVVALADIVATQTSATQTIAGLTNIVNAVVPFLLAIAVVVFIYGVIKYVIVQDAESKVSARSYIIWGIVGIAVILSVFGLAKLLQNSFGISNTTIDSSQLPSVTPR